MSSDRYIQIQHLSTDEKTPQKVFCLERIAEVSNAVFYILREAIRNFMYADIPKYPASNSFLSAEPMLFRQKNRQLPLD